MQVTIDNFTEIRMNVFVLKWEHSQILYIVSFQRVFLQFSDDHVKR